MKLHLASSSERRRDILRVLGVQFSWAGEDLDETPLAGESAHDLVLRLALAKAVAARQSQPDVPVIVGADTVVVLDGETLGKPTDRDHAIAMLTALSNRRHDVLTAVAVNTRETAITEVSRTEVEFRAIDGDEAAAYWMKGEPRGKAGGYAIQGYGGVFVRSVSGSYSGVVGLPVYETAALLRRVGIDVIRLQNER